MVVHKPDSFNTSALPEARRQIPVKIIDVPDMPTLPLPVLRPSKHPSGMSNGMKEWSIVGFFLLIMLVIRLYAALHAGLEVDEPIYRDAALLTFQYGYPALRPAYLHPVIPFLYHPPFFLFFLAEWFKLWGNTSYLTGRMSSVSVSLVMLLLLYIMTKQIMGRKVAFVSLLLIGCDPWIVFTNQAIYLENSLMIIIILTFWAYWRATRTAPSSYVRYLGWYACAGLLAGCAIIYKQIGGIVIPAIGLSLLLQRKHWYGHLILFICALLVVESYVLSMHHTFGALYDSATLDQLWRTLGQKKAPGLNDSVITALEAIWSLYWMFFITILVLVVGAALSLMRYVQHLLQRNMIHQPVILSWAAGGVVFALGISLKSPHYMILWIVPLYLIVAQEIVEVFWKKKLPFHLHVKGFLPYAPAFGLLLCVLILIGDAWGVQARFSHIPGDALRQSEAYMNETLPPDAIVLTQNYIGVDLTPQFLDITLVTTPQLILQKKVTYMALYWSQTQPISPGLGPVNRYCMPMKTFNGFKDHVEVCKINLVALAAVAKQPKRVSRGVP
jgi:4-amino-4-deoxy-L-arabinose transferase-like glycosyltransferase